MKTDLTPSLAFTFFGLMAVPYVMVWMTQNYIDWMVTGGRQ